MEDQEQSQINQIKAILQNKDIEVITKKLQKRDVSCQELLQELISSDHPLGIQILQNYSNNFSLLKGKLFVALILYLSTRQTNIETIILADQQLSTNQYVGKFVQLYEVAIQEDNPLSQQIVNHIVENKKNVPNFELIFNNTYEIAKQKGLQNLEEFEQLINQKKENVLVVDRPIIKIIALTPRIKMDYLPKHLQVKKGPNAISKSEELRLMQRKTLMTKKKLMRELYSEQNQLHKIKREKVVEQIGKQKEVYKRGLQMLEEQQMELNKLRTTQLNIKRHKKHSTRKGGNKQ